MQLSRTEKRLAGAFACAMTMTAFWLIDPVVRADAMPSRRFSKPARPIPPKGSTDRGD